MSSDRIDFFAPEEDKLVDVNAFTSKGRRPGPTRQELDAVAGPKFVSREPLVAPQQPARKEVFRHRTGRTMQFNARMKPETVDSYNALRDQTGRPMGEILEWALVALLREREREEGKTAGEGS